jgi:hypothetical protein
MGRFGEVSLDPEQRLRLAAKVRAMPAEFDGQSHPFELSAEPQGRPSIAPVAHTSVFYVPER